MAQDIDEFQQETKDAAVKEVVHKIETDDDYAESVAKALTNRENAVKAMLDDGVLLSKLSERLLTGDSSLMDKVRGELEAEGLQIESDGGESYDRKKAMDDFGILAKACRNNTSPETIAKATGKGSSVVTKSTDETNFTSAGLTIPTPLADEIIPILDSEPVFIGAGANVMTMPQGKIDIGRQNADPTAQWQGEGTSVSTSDAGFDLLQLTAHKLTAGHEFSNDFLRRDGRLIGQEYMFSRLMKVAKNKLDATIFEGGGGSNEPEGLIVQTDSSQVNGTSGNSITNITTDLRTMKRSLSGADIPNDDRQWFMRPEVEIDLMFDINSNEDTFPLREELAENGTLFGDEVNTTTNIDLDGSDQSNLYYCEMTEMLVGRSTDFEMATSPHEKFTQDLTILRLVSHWDFQMAHDKGAAITTDYTLQS